MKLRLPHQTTEKQHCARKKDNQRLSRSILHKCIFIYLLHHLLLLLEQAPLQTMQSRLFNVIFAFVLVLHAVKGQNVLTTTSGTVSWVRNCIFEGPICKSECFLRF